MKDPILFRYQFSPNWSTGWHTPNPDVRRLFVEINKLILKFIWKYNNNYEKKNNVARLTLLDFKTHNKAIVIKSAVLEERQIDECNKVQTQK